MSDSIYEACLDATHKIWDDRDAYILAVLKKLKLDPDMDYDKYLRYHNDVEWL